MRPIETFHAVQSAIGNAEEALRYAGFALVELDAVAESAIGVLNEASLEAFASEKEQNPTRRVERLEDVADAHVDRLRARAEFISNGSRDLIENLDRATVAADYAGRMLEAMESVEGQGEGFSRLQAHVARIDAVLTHTVPLAEQVAKHGDAILELTGVFNAPTAERILDTHQRVGRTAEDVDLLRSLITGGHASSKTALGLTRELSSPPDLGHGERGVAGGRHAAPRR